MLEHVPQIIYLTIALVGIGFKIAKHGQSYSDKHDAITSGIATAIVLAILVWGGFFRGMI